MPAATADAAPPEEPPAIWAGFHGLRHGPRCADSVVPVMPNSGVFVLPSSTSPVARYRRTSSLSEPSTVEHKNLLPEVLGQPVTLRPRSLIKKGTPLNGPLGSGLA